MKTRFTSASKALRYILPILLCLVVVSAHAQRSHASVGIKTMVSGNGLAAAPALTFSYSLPKVEIELGANFQLRNTHFSGVQGNICWYASKPGRKMRLGFFVGARYLYASALSNKVILQEKYITPESSLDFESMQLGTIEEQIGFGMRVQHAACFNSFYGIGIGAYQTIGDTSKYVEMHREKSGLQLVLNFGVRYSFIR